VLRAIFRACYAKFRGCVEHPRYLSQASVRSNKSTFGLHNWGLPHEEFIADFCLVSRRSLNKARYRIFSAHFLLRGDWKLCCRQLHMDRGAFFHEVYRIEQVLGRTFRELRPYPLFPIDEYLASVPGRAQVSVPAGTNAKETALTAPLRAKTSGGAV
jgi:hypothetical protein